MSGSLSRPMPLDQAYGLRRLFAHTQVLFVPVVSNPHFALGGVMLERLCTAFSMLGKRTLVIDAAEHSPQPHEMADIDLAACVETLSSDVFYLAGRGLPLRYVDPKGSTAPFLEAVCRAAPQAEVVLVHANAVDLCRLFNGGVAKPLMMADDYPNSVTHAYAAMKLLTQRANLKVYDLLLCVDPDCPRAERIAVQLASCAEDFFGGVLRQSVRIDPVSAAQDAPAEELMRWAYLVLQGSENDWDQGVTEYPAAIQKERAQSHHSADTYLTAN